MRRRMSEPKSACGPHHVIVSTDGVRLAKCPCGAFHVTLVQSGVTLQLTRERLGELGRAIGVALPPEQAEGIRVSFSSASRIDN